jgi:DNA-binding NarL/FixJ family response regulator
LIAEDSEGVRLYLRGLIRESFPECDCFEARDGEEAVALASLHSPEIILMDIGLPNMNGIEATRRIKEAVPKTQVVIVTNHEATEYEKEAAIAGASAYVLKHRIHTELIPVMTRLLSQSQRDISDETIIPPKDKEINS